MPPWLIGTPLPRELVTKWMIRAGRSPLADHQCWGSDCPSVINARKPRTYSIGAIDGAGVLQCGECGGRLAILWEPHIYTYLADLLEEQSSNKQEMP